MHATACHYKNFSIKNNYCLRTIRLENGLTALLISDPSKPSENEDDTTGEEESSGTEQSSSSDTDGNKSEQSSSSDHHGTKRHNEFDEEKLVSWNNYAVLFPFWLDYA